MGRTRVKILVVQGYLHHAIYIWAEEVTSSRAHTYKEIFHHHVVRVVRRVEVAGISITIIYRTIHDNKVHTFIA